MSVAVRWDILYLISVGAVIAFSSSMNRPCGSMPHSYIPRQFITANLVVTEMGFFFIFLFFSITLFLSILASNEACYPTTSRCLSICFSYSLLPGLGNCSIVPFPLPSDLHAGACLTHSFPVPLVKDLGKSFGSAYPPRGESWVSWSKALLSSIYN